MLITINIFKSFKMSSDMAKLLEPEMNKNGAKMIWAGANADESAVYVLAEMKDPSDMKTFGERPDIRAIRKEGGADVGSTTVVSPMGDCFIG